MKTAEEKFYQDHPRSPRQMDWDKYEKEAPFFDSGCVIEFAESYASEQNAELRKEMDDLIAANEIIVKNHNELLKENEELKSERESRAEHKRLTEEITRLKELLGRVHQNIKLDLMYIPGEKNRHQNILIEIDNALNHKP